jgi:hypothetical protein
MAVAATSRSWVPTSAPDVAKPAHSLAWARAARRSKESVGNAASTASTNAARLPRCSAVALCTPCNSSEAVIAAIPTSSFSPSCDSKRSATSVMACLAGRSRRARSNSMKTVVSRIVPMDRPALARRRRLGLCPWIDRRWPDGVEHCFHVLGERGVGRRSLREQCKRLSQGPSAARDSHSPMIVGMNDDVDRSLPVEHHDLLAMGDRFPSPTWNPDFLSFDRGHRPHDSRSVRKCTKPYGVWGADDSRPVTANCRLETCSNYAFSGTFMVEGARLATGDWLH